MFGFWARRSGHLESAASAPPRCPQPAWRAAELFPGVKRMLDFWRISCLFHQSVPLKGPCDTELVSSRVSDDSLLWKLRTIQAILKNFSISSLTVTYLSFTPDFEWVYWLLFLDLPDVKYVDHFFLDWSVFFEWVDLIFIDFIEWLTDLLIKWITLHSNR